MSRALKYLSMSATESKSITASKGVRGRPFDGGFNNTDFAKSQLADAEVHKKGLNFMTSTRLSPELSARERCIFEPSDQIPHIDSVNSSLRI